MCNRQKSLCLIIHEILHILNPTDSELAIIKKSITLTKVLWKEGYRKVDDTNDMPLQDGSI